MPRRWSSEIVAKGLSVRQAEALAKQVRPGAGHDIGRASARNAKPVDADLAALERQLGDMLGAQGQGRAQRQQRHRRRCITAASISST